MITKTKNHHERNFMLEKAMNLLFAPDPREVSFFALAPQAKIKEKRYRVWAGTIFNMKWDVAAQIF